MKAELLFPKFWSQLNKNIAFFIILFCIISISNLVAANSSDKGFVCKKKSSIQASSLQTNNQLVSKLSEIIYSNSNNSKAADKFLDYLSDNYLLRQVDHPAANSLEELLSLQTLQKISLMEIMEDQNVSNSLKKIVKEKLRHYKHITNRMLDELKETLKEGTSQTSKHFKNVASLEFVLKSFISIHLDTSLRSQLIKDLSTHPHADKNTIELFLTIARGVNSVHDDEIIDSAKAIDEITNRLGKKNDLRLEETTGPPPNPNLSPQEEMLINAPISKIVSNSNRGYNSSYIVTFKNKEKAIFKPRKEEASFYKYTDSILPPNIPQKMDDYTWHAIAYVREFTAPPIVEEWLQIKKLREEKKSGIIVPPTVERIIVGKDGKNYGVGSLQLFMKDFKTFKNIQEKNPELWKKINSNEKFLDDLSRVKTIDYILGNFDRFPNHCYTQGNMNNIMLKVDPKTLDYQIALIDNGIGRPGYDSFSIEDVPIPEHIPNDFKEVILAFDDNGFRKAFKNLLPAAGIEDVINRVHQVQKRVSTPLQR